jgi:hypothetical protein
MPLERRPERDLPDDWDDLEPAPRKTVDDFWDAFDLDDARAEPQPEYGDFWPEPDDCEWV